ncbi:MAG: hypothetical protein K9J85_08885 [Desulfobacteraceae bacterium]|nr:hypothetical protein [Desulfobacteraceae bacterium]
MKQKYSIVKDDKTGDLAIQEYAELSKDMFSLVCEEAYEKDRIQSAVKEDKKALIDILRTPNLYPISDYIDKIADAVIGLYQTGKQSEPVELVFDDVDLFKSEEEKDEAVEEDSVEIEDLLEDDSDDKDSGKDKDIKDEEK